MTNPQSNSLKGADSEDDAENDAYRAEVNGDEAVGIEVDDDTPLATEEMLKKRDRDRWELDSASAVDH
jgi:hypothetical protein